MSPGMLKKLDKIQGIQWAEMLVEQRKEALFQQLDLSGLEGWSAKNWAATHTPSWIPWSLFLGTRGVGLHWSDKTQDQSHWWWTLQREIPENLSSYGIWSSFSCERDARSGCNLPKLCAQCACTLAHFGDTCILCYYWGLFAETSLYCAKAIHVSISSKQNF